MTRREQWKALRASVVRKAWVTRCELFDYYNVGCTILGLARITVSRVYAASRLGRGVYDAVRGWYPSRDFGEALNKLTAMREAERSGVDPVLWKLRQP